MMNVSPENMLYEELRLDGTGVAEVTSDYSSSATPFYVEPSSGEVWVVRRMIGSYQDASGGTMSEYGNLGDPLTTGITMKIFNSSADIKVLNATPVLSNGHWGAKCYDVDQKTWGQGDELFVFRWSFFKDVPEGIILDSALGNRLGFVAEDDFEGLVSHHFEIRGYKVAPPHALVDIG